MTNYSSKILNNAVGALNAQQAVIATTANNISNVNTPGYARRVADLQTRVTTGTTTGISVGNGVEVGRILRMNDAFVDRSLRGAQSDAASAQVQNEFLDRIQQLYSLTGDRNTIGSAVTAFFSSVNDLQANPSSIELRSNVLARSNELASSISDTYNSLASMQTEADQRLQTEVSNVNSLCTQIAQLNGLVSAREVGTGAVAADERDRRDQLLEQLSKKANFNILEQADGSVSVSLANGFSLVTGTTANALETTQNPSFGTLPPSLDGTRLSSIVYDYDTTSGQQHVDLTHTITGGVIGGLLAIRGTTQSTDTSAFQADGTIVEAASRVEAITRQLLTTFNEAYRGSADRVAGGAFDASSVDLNGNTPGLFGFFNFAGAPASNVSGIPTGADLTAAGHDNYSSLLSVAITDPRAIAAAIDLSGGAVTPTFAPGDGRNLANLTAQQTTNRTFTAGNFSFTGTYEGAYNEAVTKIGNDASRAALSQKVAESSLEAAQSHRDEVSAVSLDEEFANLVKFQKAYQASARMIKVSEQLLDEVIQLL